MTKSTLGRVVLTRENIESGATLKHIRRVARELDALYPNGPQNPSIPIRSEAEITQCCREFLSQRPKQAKRVWVFGYGSLIWNPAFHFQRCQVARIYGYHRSFCLLSTMGRGSPNAPGVMLALDRGGSCSGRAFLLRSSEVETEMQILWRREMLSDSYEPVWLRVHGEEGPAYGFTFVVSRTGTRYRPNLTLDEQARLIRNGHGHLGTCAEYLDNTARHLADLGIRDRAVSELLRRARNLKPGDAPLLPNDYFGDRI